LDGKRCRDDDVQRTASAAAIVGRAADKKGQRLREALAGRLTACLKAAGADRAEQVGFCRYLANDRVTVGRLVADWSTMTRAAVAGRHVLAIQDTSEINFSTTAPRRRGLGKVGRGNTHGALLHAMLACDADDLTWLGLVTGEVWTRPPGPLSTPHAQRRLADKESRRWVTTPQAAKPILAQARQVTVIADRESDLYDVWACVPAPGFEVLVRARHDRVLADRRKLSHSVARWPVVGTRSVRLPARSPFQPARDALLSLRFGSVEISRPNNHLDKTLAPTIRLSVVDVGEQAPPKRAKPIAWRLMTTHRVDSAEQAWQIVDWYRARWLIEELFRVMKKRGFDIEDSQLADATRLVKLIAVTAHVACMALQLTQARDGKTARPASDAFTDRQIDVLTAINPALDGRTQKQKNPHPPRSLAFAAWVIARLGHWHGPHSGGKPGHITFARGLARFFQMILDAKLLATFTPLRAALNVCIA
jgi:hypothetical protein